MNIDLLSATAGSLLLMILGLGLAYFIVKNVTYEVDQRCIATDDGLCIRGCDQPCNK